MASAFDPTELLRSLESAEVEFILIGGLAATIYGSPYVTTDADIVPSRGHENLNRLASVLKSLDARVRTEGVPNGLPFDATGPLLEGVEILNLMTRHGNLGLTFVPSGTQGFADLSKNARTITIHGVSIRVASLADVIRSKEAANRERDRLVLPTLRKLLDLSEG